MEGGLNGYASGAFVGQDYGNMFGLGFATVLTRFVAPVLFALFYGLRYRSRRPKDGVVPALT